MQLKRFEYDFERVCAIKFNDYFEFPRDLDVEPYTGKQDNFNWKDGFRYWEAAVEVLANDLKNHMYT